MEFCDNNILENIDEKQKTTQKKRKQFPIQTHI